MAGSRCAGDKALKDRWNSVGKTGKLTDAMRLVASAKVQSTAKWLKNAKSMIPGDLMVNSAKFTVN